MINNIHTRAKTILNVEQYNTINKPESVGYINMSCPYNTQYILRMLIQRNNSTCCIPRKLFWLAPFINKCRLYQEEVIGIKHSFAYLTVRHGLVKSVTDDLWHVDGFSMRINHIPEQNYAWSNIDPTEYAFTAIDLKKISFDPLKHNIHNIIQCHVSNKDIRKTNVNEIICFDPYVIHRRPTVSVDTVRTFIRLSFVPIEIADKNNTINPLLPTNYTLDGVKDFRNTLI